MDLEDHIQFNLLAIVENKYQKASDELEMLKREKLALERRLNEEFNGAEEKTWKSTVSVSLLVLDHRPE